jgi:hypothetical protein
VCCPADPLISHALKLLGFHHVNFLEPGKPLILGYIRAYSRRFTTHHRIYGDAAGVHVMPVQLPDLLMHYLIYVAKGSAVSARQRIEPEFRN